MAAQNRGFGTRKRHAGSWNLQALADLRSKLPGDKYRFEWEPDEFGHVTVFVDGEQRRAFLTSVPHFYEYIHGMGMLGLWRSSEHWYMYDHDEVLDRLEKMGKFVHTSSWKRGAWNYNRPPAYLIEIMSKYIIHTAYEKIPPDD